MAQTTADTLAIRPARMGDLSRYTQDPNYQYVQTKTTSVLGKIWDAIIRSILDALGIPENAISQNQWFYIKLSLASLLLLCVGIWVYKKYLKSAKSSWWVNNPAWDAAVSTRPTPEAAIDWRQQLQQALAQQAYRDAVRCLYWALLLDLAQRQCLRLDPNKTNADYSRELTLRQARTHFDQISRHFAVVWYGHHATTEASYVYMKSLCEQFKDQWLSHEG